MRGVGRSPTTSIYSGSSESRQPDWPGGIELDVGVNCHQGGEYVVPRGGLLRISNCALCIHMQSNIALTAPQIDLGFNDRRRV
jgi:hypothetical protein